MRVGPGIVRFGQLKAKRLNVVAEDASCGLVAVVEQEAVVGLDREALFEWDRKFAISGRLGRQVSDAEYHQTFRALKYHDFETDIDVAIFAITRVRVEAD